MSNQAESKANTANMEYLNLHHEAVRLFRDIYLEPAPRPPGREYPQGASLLMAAKGGPVLFKISESEGCKMARSARHKRSLKRDIKRGFIPMPRKKNAQNPRERNRPYSDMDRDDRMQWWANGEPV